MTSNSAYPQGTRNPKDISLYLLRHARSRSNNNSKLHHKLADHKIPLSRQGQCQAKRAAMQVLKSLPSGVEQVTVWVSPFMRTRQTAKPLIKLLQQCGIIVRLHERDELVEQLFGLFDGYDEDQWPTEFPREYASYKKWADHEGRYFAKMPDGESRFDVYQRLQAFIGAVHREHTAAGTCHHIVVSHGVTLRMLTKLWMKYSVEWAEKEPNPANVSLRVIKARRDHGYVFPGFQGNTLKLAKRPADREIKSFKYGLKTLTPRQIKRRRAKALAAA